ncbi:ABC transporter permease [Salinisphaera sp. LB1]|uniref:ABC transporter permease n=1 Tax=unclassified Salinisphaera TaxID=2649847 RepID=UPI000D706E9F|nr:ABC transporter permease [Salinisphaera sp. LB1]AWN15055.1 Dipeptide transport system permease protein dppC [Salinisphaera sp. LB1]
MSASEIQPSAPAPPSRRARLAQAPATLWIGLVLFGSWIFIAIFGTWLAPHGMGDMVSGQVFAGPSSQFPLGTDHLGRDVLSRILIATRYTVGMALAAAVLSSAIGAAFGMIVALSPRFVDLGVSQLMDALISIPSKMMALLVVAVFGSSIPLLIVAAVASYAPGAYRIARSLALNHAQMEYVAVARCRGERRAYIAIVELLPNIFGPVLTDMGMRFVFIVLLLSAMSFLGLGVQPPMADLGSMVRENISGLNQGALAVIAPAVAIGMLTVGANLLIDSISSRRNG